jgi:hypothetical protein
MREPLQRILYQESQATSRRYNMSSPHDPTMPVGQVADFGSRDLDCDGMFLAGDGHVYPADANVTDLPAFEPAGGLSSGARIVFVNGVLTPAEAQVEMCRSLADATGAGVVALHNGTSGDALVDGLQCLGDKGARVLHEFGLPYRNDATASVVRLVEDAVDSGTPINLFGHSQGGLILSSAVREVTDRLVVQGDAPDEIAAKLSVVHVQTFGGAAWSYPDGIDAYHHVNVADPVPDFAGRGPFDIGHVIGDALLGSALPEGFRAVIGEAELLVSGTPRDEVIDDYARQQTFDHPEPWFHPDGAFDLQAHSARLYFDELRNDPAALGAIACVAESSPEVSPHAGPSHLLQGHVEIDDWSAPVAPGLPNYANDADGDQAGSGGWAWSLDPGSSTHLGEPGDSGGRDAVSDDGWGWSGGDSGGSDDGYGSDAGHRIDPQYEVDDSD